MSQHVFEDGKGRHTSLLYFCDYRTRTETVWFVGDKLVAHPPPSSSPDEKDD